MSGLLLFLLFGLPAILTAGATIASNVSNATSTQSTNESNLQVARETNAANADQADLAYQRSLPVNQVRDMMSAGMSKAAALNKLAGGGTYSAPVMQSAQAQPNRFDFSQLAEIGERAANIPANVQQREIVDQQIASAKQEFEQKQQLFKLEMQERAQRLINERNEELRKQYGQNVLEQTDKLRSDIVRIASEKGVDINTLRTEQDVVNLVGDLDSWKSAPAAARDNVLANLQLHNQVAISNRAADDAHRESNDKHAISQQSLSDMRAIAADYQRERAARGAEYALRETRAKSLNLLEQVGLSENVLKHNLYLKRDKDGNLVPTLDLDANVKIKEIWRIIANILGLEYLGDLLKGIIRIG